MPEEMKTLVVTGLRTQFNTAKGPVAAVRDVNLKVARGEIVGLVGESGSGKSVTGLSIMGLIDAPGEITAGAILLNGEDLRKASPKRLRELRGDRIAMIFQDPMMTLNPVLRIDTQMIEAIRVHDHKVGRQEARERCRDALGLVGIPSPEERLEAYPHEFSGGMRQRVAIAIAMLNRPDIIIADEPTTALDVTIQSQILAQMQKLCRDTGTALIWITHDLTVVAGLTDRVYVMYAGDVVEEAPVEDLLDRPIHPYTDGLIRSIPSHNAPGQPLNQIPGITPALDRMPAGCRFHPRCPRRTDACLEEIALRSFGPAREARCIHPLVEG
ncbi:ABC transporter ATP-binding protein [Consotaella salsifontis]|uniref:Peptide/nickel transport system ATP-binding protein n=1 Tax=Consotaella salsifontis TaxID=1365950 RepID=A0A1T4SUL2_9HYPH|nr:ABC transporter ATP-binding protein [Consotaella salsifontis]SKA31965.1 peptide/nickel transport system ATP-binding protein [Consotaella salsifontis]